jgi:hypothetical protein
LGEDNLDMEAPATKDLDHVVGAHVGGHGPGTTVNRSDSVVVTDDPRDSRKSGQLSA